MKTSESETIAGVLDEKMNRQLLYYLDICTRCSICKDACHQYVTTGDVLYLPAYRAELMRRVYRKYFTSSGRLYPALSEGTEINDKLLDDLYQTMYACTGCRRCMYYCPFSIDTTWFMAVAKTMLITAGRGSQILTELAGAAVMKGENIELFRDIITETLKETEKELQERVGSTQATIPTDKKGADLLYVALAGTHTILPAAVIFHKAKASWTLSLFEAANYGYFLGDVKQARAISRRIIDEAKSLEVKEIVITECGHAYRVMQFLYEAWAKEELPFIIRGIVELMAEYIRQGKLKLTPEKIKQTLTYHDPCQVGRNAGFYEEPRYIINQIASDFHEMTPNREKNWCCGGGGGVVAQPDFDEFRIKTGEKKVEQIKKTGAKIVVSPCENCRLQLDSLKGRYNMAVEIISMMDLVANAIV